MCYMFGDILAQASEAGQLPGIRWDRPADLSDREVQEKLSPAAVRAFFSLAGHWKLRDEDARALLGGMFKALNILYSAKLADAWVQRPNTNPIFGGESPLAHMLKGGVPSMIRVRQ